MPSTCGFELNKPNAIYYSGEIITGTITLHTTSDKNVRDVSIIFLGEGKVKWQESHTTSNSSGDSTTHTTYYRSHELYVNNCTCVRGEGILPVGTHTYTFAIPLPLECPTSLEGKYGHIRYELTLKLNRPYRFDNVYKKPLTVIRTIDLNLDPLYRIPVVIEEYSELCCSCKSDRILYTLRIPFGAYAPGQAVKYSLHIANQTLADVEGYCYKFIKKTTFTAKSPSRKTREIKDTLVDRNFREPCPRLTTRLIEGQFVIPAVPPSTSYDSIICVQYKLKVFVVVSGCNANAELKIPITIGTIPLRESLAVQQNVPNIHENVTPSAPVLPTDNINDNVDDMPPSYQDLKPPSFEEGTRSNSPFIDTDVDERNRIVGFRPLYPMYT